MAVHETIKLAVHVDQPEDLVWQAFADRQLRARWTAPSSEVVAYDHDDFCTGGSARYRSGPRGDLMFAAHVDYLQVHPTDLLVHTETVREGHTLLCAGLLTWTFTPGPAGTTVSLVEQITSFVGASMVEGRRHTRVQSLRRLEALTGVWAIAS